MLQKDQKYQNLKDCQSSDVLSKNNFSTEEKEDLKEITDL
jgi:hypothetical protein